MEKNNLIGYGLLGLTLALLIVSVVWITKQGNPTGFSTASTGMSSEGFSSNEEMMKAHHPEQASGQMSSEGFSSNEEMMKAHHGSGASVSSEDGCGGVESGAAASPLVGKTSEYGIIYGNEGYKQLVNAVQTVTLSKAQESVIVGLDIELPCCGVKTLQATNNCGCGHHQAMFGLAKTLASQGVSRDKIQAEINNWKTVFYPGGAEGSTGACTA